MILITRNIDLKISNQELEYAMGFLMDMGKTKETFKHYVGHKTHEDQFYFEDKDKGNWGNIKATMFTGYFIKNIPGEKLVLSLFVTTKKLGLFVIFNLVFIVVFFFASFAFPAEDGIIAKILAPSLTAFFWLMGLGFMLFNFFITKNELKKTIETRLRVRKYHQGKNE